MPVQTIVRPDTRPREPSIGCAHGPAAPPMTTAPDRCKDPSPAADIHQSVGRTLRELRELKKMTARDLAARAGVSPAMISRIETGQVSPSLTLLEAVAAALETPMVSLFRDTGSAVCDFTHVAHGEGLKSVRLMGDHLHAFSVLGFHRRPGFQFEAVCVVIERNAHASPPTYTGSGCVFVYVLEGEAIYRYGDHRVRLAPGDSLSLDAELRYGVQEVLTPRLRFLSIQAERS